MPIFEICNGLMVLPMFARIIVLKNPKLTRVGAANLPMLVADLSLPNSFYPGGDPEITNRRPRLGRTLGYDAGRSDRVV
ncbi:hypothetical protein [Rhizobium ruizarguesonis]|uniref:hypothetical protein n=1 Tax=Rhizobium ruizarguesonis TaxID=2081791 RepID=UPI0013EEA775|nr:hypothetical protein [Rhizobium ruizarguesonis]